jgi:hypothetical protein
MVNGIIGGMTDAPPPKEPNDPIGSRRGVPPTIPPPAVPNKFGSNPPPGVIEGGVIEAFLSSKLLVPGFHILFPESSCIPGPPIKELSPINCGVPPLNVPSAENAPGGRLNPSLKFLYTNKLSRTTISRSIPNKSP